MTPDSGKPRLSDAVKRFLDKLSAERRREREAQRIAECAEWYIAPDVVPTSAEAKMAVAQLIGDMRLTWFEGRKW